MGANSDLGPGARFPDHQTLRGVLTLATRAPSARDSQPWRWRVGSDSLTLHADAGCGLPRADLLLSCGATLHHCTVALAAMGWQSTITRLPDPRDPGLMARVEVSPRPADDLDVTLAAAIGRRRTDRRDYASWPVPWSDIALMGARAARAGVMLRQIGQATEGLGAWSLGPARGVPIALGTEADDETARLRAGEATSLVLLSATAMGLASCSASEPLAAAETREAVRAEVFGGAGHPQMLVRVGWAALDAEPLPELPLRPLSDVADWHHHVTRIS